MPGLSLRTRLTVASLTPACLATSARFPATRQVYGSTCRTLQVSARDRPDPRGHCGGRGRGLPRPGVPVVRRLAAVGGTSQLEDVSMLRRQTVGGPRGCDVLR